MSTMSTMTQLRPRRSYRRAARMAVIMVFETEGEQERYDTCTLDVSRHGARVQAGISLTPGQLVEIFPGEGNDPIAGRVVWVGKPASETEGQAGLEFLDPSNISV